MTEESILDRLGRLRQYQLNGHRAPHKPLLLLMALGQLLDRGTSELRWSEVETRLSNLIAEFAPVAATGSAQRAAYPFTRLRSDGVWELDRDAPMDRVRPLSEHDVIGRLEPQLEMGLLGRPDLIRAAAYMLVESQFPPSVVGDVLLATGFDPAASTESVQESTAGRRRRDPNWRSAVLLAWDRSCGFCGYDGQLVGATVGVDAAHIRWFAFDGPDELDNGLALCTLHHKLFDLGVLGLGPDLKVRVSNSYTARTQAGRAVYELHGTPLSQRPGTPPPAPQHLQWHEEEVFKLPALAV